ncbi:MAG: outer membrane beta-barrel protein [Acidobacteria bacterium]|nr:outer membrane beta-barrel protein [Acidobacteriota bacterium]
MQAHSFKMSYLCGVGAVIFASPCLAQITNRLTFGAGAGFTSPVRWSENRLDTGFNFMAHAGMNVSPRIGARIEFGYNQLGISSAVLQSIGVPSGSARVYSLTLNPEIRLNPKGRFDAYATFGGGYYRRTVELTQPTVAIVTAFDPFYGVFFPIGVPAEQVLDSYSQNKGGLNVGGGVAFRFREDGRAQFFAETKYHYIFTSGRTTLVPVTFGVRW